MTKNWRRLLQAQLRDARVLFNESRIPIFVFIAVLLLGTLTLVWLYRDPETGAKLGVVQALYATFSMVFFENVLAFPQNGVLRLLFFLIPVLGLAAVADGVIRFGSALVTKQNRGEKWQVAMASTYSNHLIVCGIGKLGYRVIEELLKLGQDVVGIELNPDGRFVEQARGLGIPILIADARRAETLVKANIAQARAILLCTEDELTNLGIALEAREAKPGIKVVLRMFDADLARRVETGFGIHTAFSTSALSAPVFAAAAMDVNIRSSFYVGENLLNLCEFIVQGDAELTGLTAGRLAEILDVSVVYYQFDGVVDLHPSPDRVLMPGTQILVLATLEKLHRLKALNAGKAK